MTSEFSGQTIRAVRMAKVSAFVDDVKKVAELLKLKGAGKAGLSRTHAKPMMGLFLLRSRMEPSV